MHACKTYALAGLLSVLVVGAQPLSADWQAQLEQGGQVSVDPRSNRVTVTRDGVTTPLWDGVHRLRDGSVIRVRAGQIVPNEAILRAREQPPAPVSDPAQAWVGQPIQGSSPCERLVERVCGPRGRCADSPACDPAHQLLDRERAERADSDAPGTMTYTSGQCLQADRDTGFFRTCGQ